MSLIDEITRYQNEARTMTGVSEFNSLYSLLEQCKATILELQADKAGINTTAEDALAFYDDVRGASVEEKIAVGTDHYDYILKTLRQIAKHTGGSNGTD